MKQIQETFLNTESNDNTIILPPNKNKHVRVQSFICRDGGGLRV